MKKVEFINFISQNKVLVMNLTDLINSFEFVGFEVEDTDCGSVAENRYMIVSNGPHKGLAFNVWNCYAGSFESQKQEKGNYFVFNNANELYYWMKGE